MRADAYQQIIDNPDLNPNERQHAFTQLHQMLAMHDLADSNTEKANKQMVEQAADEYTKLIHSGQATPEMVAKLILDPRLNSDFRTRDALINLVARTIGQRHRRRLDAVRPRLLVGV